MEEYATYREKIQPYMVFVTGISGSVTASYVIVNDMKWKVPSVVKAIEVALKSTFSLNVSYSPLAYHLWLLIQRAVFKIKLTTDVNVPSVLTLLGRLK